MIIFLGSQALEFHWYVIGKCSKVESFKYLHSMALHGGRKCREWWKITPIPSRVKRLKNANIDRPSLCFSMKRLLLLLLWCCSLVVRPSNQQSDTLLNAHSVPYSFHQLKTKDWSPICLENNFWIYWLLTQCQAKFWALFFNLVIFRDVLNLKTYALEMPSTNPALIMFSWTLRGVNILFGVKVKQVTHINMSNKSALSYFVARHDQVRPHFDVYFPS